MTAEKNTTKRQFNILTPIQTLEWPTAATANFSTKHNVDKITKHPTSLSDDTFHIKNNLRKKIRIIKQQNLIKSKMTVTVNSRIELQNSENFGACRRGEKRLVFSRRSSVECSARLTTRWAAELTRRQTSGGRGERGGAHLSPPRASPLRSRSAPAPAPATSISVIRVHRRNTTYPISMDRLMIMDGKWWTIVGSRELQSF